MQRLHFFLSILILAAFLAGCNSQAAIQPEQVKALENATLTTLPDRPTPTQVETLPPEIVPHDPPASYPITVPQNPPFVPPASYDSMDFEGEFWYGSSHLWAALPTDAIWYALPRNPEGYTQKIF